MLYADDSGEAPVTAGAYQTTRRGGSHFAVAQFSPSMNLVYLTYMGGSGDEGIETHSLAVNDYGEAIVGAGTIY